MVLANTNLHTKESEKLLKYNIVFRKSREPLPENHRRTFQQIIKLGRYKFRKFRRDKTTKRSTSRSVIINRVLGLVNATKKLEWTWPSELQWRLEVENLAYARFSLAIEWYSL
jgi:uncharacterized membrane protein